MSSEPVELSQDELDRYAWQLLVPGFGMEEQRKLKASTALVTRVGGLGGPTALNLAMAGIGKLVLAHGGVVEAFHMNRMILASYEAIGRRSPAPVAAERIAALNPSVELEVHEENVTEETVDDMVAGVDIVLDCPPTFEERHLLNRACVRAGKPMVEAAVDNVEGYVTTIIPGRTACLNCLGLWSDYSLPFPILGAIPCAIGSLAALEAIKVLTGYGTPLLDRLLMFDGEDSQTRYVKVKRDPACAVCGDSAGGGRPDQVTAAHD